MTAISAISSGRTVTYPPEKAAATVVATFPLNRHQLFQAEIDMICGRKIVRICRVKRTPEGMKRTGQNFEFGSHRLRVVQQLLVDVERLLASQGGAR